MVSNHHLKIVFLLVFTTLFVVLTVKFFPAQKGIPVVTRSEPDKKIVKLGLSGIDLNRANSSGAQQSSITQAEEAYTLFAQTGNARYLGLTEKLIATWSKSEHPPKSIWLLRAKISQAKHQFNTAAFDLESLLETYPGSDYARLLAADAWRRAGKLQKAQSQCLMLGVRGRYSESKLCLTEVMLTKGDLEKAQSFLSSMEKTVTGLPLSLKRWYVILKADLLSSRDQLQSAVAVWETLDDWHALPYAYKLRLADLLIRQGNYQSASAILTNERPTLAVLLRQYRAAMLGELSDQQKIAKQLERRAFITNNAPTKALHLYERALFASWYQNDARTALFLAKQNWLVQKSYEDAELVVSLAGITGDRDSEKLITNWRSQWQ